MLAFAWSHITSDMFPSNFSADDWSDELLGVYFHLSDLCQSYMDGSLHNAGLVELLGSMNSCDEVCEGTPIHCWSKDWKNGYCDGDCNKKECGWDGTRFR